MEQTCAILMSCNIFENPLTAWLSHISRHISFRVIVWQIKKHGREALSGYYKDDANLFMCVLA